MPYSATISDQSVPAQLGAAAWTAAIAASMGYRVGGCRPAPRSAG
ncbi:hypothetical protein [Flindersiella endophytica]